MRKNINPDYPAFTDRGLSKLEYFSAVALQAIIADKHSDLEYSVEAAAEDALLYATALIEVLNDESIKNRDNNF